MIISRIRMSIGSADSLRGQLVSGGISSAIIRGASQLLALFIGIILARGLGAQNYGIYAYAIAWMLFLKVLAGFGLPALLLREAATSEVRLKWQYLRGLLVSTALIEVIVWFVLVAITASSLWLLRDEMTRSKTLTFIVMLPLLLLTVWTNATLAALRGLRHVVKSQAVEMFIYPLLLLLILAGLFTIVPGPYSPQYVMGIHVSVAAVILCVALLMLFQNLPKPLLTTPASYPIRQLLVRALPFALLASAGLINDQADILILGMLRPFDDVGIYRVSVEISGFVAFGLHAGNAVIAPNFARIYAQGDMARLQRLVTISARVFFIPALLLALIFFVAGGRIAAWIYGPEFLRAQTPLALLAAGQFVNASMGSVGYLLTMCGHEKVAVRILLWTAMLNITLNFVLIPLFGINGAASASAFTLALWNVLLYSAVKKHLRIRSTAFSFSKLTRR
uniref:Uncharacterized protein n=2 Tax=Desulfobacterium TaxID=2295 RepID=E1YE85_9BACT|nr:hypothetical protein N47_B19900 [uncultured Desulfobacterium sp.]